MAGVPERSFPMIEAEGTPTPEPVEPPRLSMGAAVGRGLSAVGEELYGVGMVAYHHAVEAQAQDKETEFQKKALQIRDQYRGLYNKDALFDDAGNNIHEKFSQSLETARAEAARAINTKDGRRLFLNNSLRTARLIQESIDSHFEQQSRSYQLTTFKQGQDVDTQTVAALAKDGNLQGASEKIKEMQAKAEAFAATRGLDSEVAAQLAASKGSHALIRTLLEAKNPLSGEAYAQWGDRLDPSYQAIAQKTIEAQTVVSGGEKILANLPRVDSDKKLNARGTIDDDAYREAIAHVPGPVRTYVEAKKRKLDEDFKDAGQQMEDRIRRLGQGRGPGGQFGVPEDSPEWQEFSALYPTRRDRLLTEAHAKARKSVMEGRADEAHAGREAFGRASEWLREAGSEEVKAITPETVADHVRQSGGRAEDVARAQSLLQKLQKEPADAVGKRIPNIARSVLNTVNPKFARAKAWQAMEYLETLHTQHPDWTPTQLGKDLNEHISKGWFGRASLNLPNLPKTTPKEKPADLKYNPVTKQFEVPK